MERKLVNRFLPYINLPTVTGDYPFLIDSGSNINFISKKLASSYKLSKPYEVSNYNIKSVGGNFSTKYAIDIAFFAPKCKEAY